MGVLVRYRGIVEVHLNLDCGKVLPGISAAETGPSFAAFRLEVTIRTIGF